MPGCSIDSECSLQFSRLKAAWKKDYPSVETDLQDAFKAICKDIKACHCRGPLAKFEEVLGAFKLFKYRHKNKQAREGASGGWRFHMLYDEMTGVMYPIIVYPKKEWQDASDDLITDAIKELIAILKARLKSD